MDIFITIYVQSVFIGMYEIRFKSLLNKMKDDIPEMNRIILFTRGLLPEISFSCIKKSKYIRKDD